MLQTPKSPEQDLDKLDPCKSIFFKISHLFTFSFAQHSLDVGNQAIQACMHCEKTITILNHLRVHHKDVSALIKLQRQLVERRKGLFYLKRHEPLAYSNVLKVYGLTDLQSTRGEGITHKHFNCKRRKGAPAARR